MKLVYSDTSHSYMLDGRRAKSVTAVAKLVADSFALDEWRKRQVAIGMTLEPRLRERVAVDLDNREAVGAVCEEAMRIAGAHHAADRGTQLHRASELSDLDRLLVTEQQEADAAAWRATLEAYSITIDPQFVEAFVAYPEFGVVGRLDRLGRLDDDLVLLDLKSGAGAIRYPQTTAAQLALYANAPHVSAAVVKDGDRCTVTEWTEMPYELVRSCAYVVHLVPDQPIGELWSVDIRTGWDGAQLALKLVDWRKQKDYGRQLAQQIVAPVPPAVERDAAGDALARPSPAAELKEKPCGTSTTSLTGVKESLSKTSTAAATKAPSSVPTAKVPSTDSSTLSTNTNSGLRSTVDSALTDRTVVIARTKAPADLKEEPSTSTPPSTTSMKSPTAPKNSSTTSDTNTSATTMTSSSCSATSKQASPPLSTDRTVIVERVRALVDSGHANSLAYAWPEGVPGFKTDYRHSDAELSAILTVVRQVEDEHSMPFHQADAPTPIERVLGFTGTRQGMTPEQETMVHRLTVGHYDVLHHGDCVGADADMHRIALANGQRIVIHPPTDNRLRAACESADMLPAKPYLERNKDIVDACGFLIATPAEYAEQEKDGTWHTVRYARSKNKPGLIVWPDGNISELAPRTVPTSPVPIDEGPNIDSATYDALKARHNTLNDTARTRLEQIAYEAQAAQVPISLVQLRSVRRWEIARGLILWSDAGWHDDVIRDLLADIVHNDDIRQPATPLGAVIGTLTIDEAHQFAEMAQQILHGATLEYGDRGWHIAA